MAGETKVKTKKPAIMPVFLLGYPAVV